MIGTVIIHEYETTNLECSGQTFSFDIRAKLTVDKTSTVSNRTQYKKNTPCLSTSSSSSPKGSYSLNNHQKKKSIAHKVMALLRHEKKE